MKKIAGIVAMTMLSLLMLTPCAFAAQENPLDHAALAAKEAQEEDALETLEMPDGAWELTPRGYIAEDLKTIIPGAVAKGIDVSSWQGKIDWAAVKASGVSFAIIRAGYGSDFDFQDDAYFTYNVSECERLGIPYGLYLYSYAENASMAQSEADHMLRLVKGHKPAYPLYLDLEHDSSVPLATIASTFCDAIQKAGYTPGIYANLYWFNNYLTESTFAKWDHWVAQFDNACTYGGTYSMWQAASDARVPGVTGNVDVDFDYNPARAGYGAKLGDANLNGKVNILDAQIAYDLVTNKYGSEWSTVAAQRPGWTKKSLTYLLDVNKDGAVNATDAFAIQSYALRGRWG